MKLRRDMIINEALQPQKARENGTFDLMGKKAQRLFCAIEKMFNNGTAFGHTNIVRSMSRELNR